MSRAARTTVGSVVAGVLAFVALVAGVMSVVGTGDGVGGLQEWDLAGVDTPATAEVLDVDDDWEWPTVDVRWTTDDGEVVVTYVDWGWAELPEVGEEVEVVHDAADPEYAYAADDPYVAEVLADPAAAGAAGGTAGDGEDPQAVAADGALARTAGWVALTALAGLVVTVVVTVVAAVRAPAPPPQAHVTSVYEAPFPHQAPYQAPNQAPNQAAYPGPQGAAGASPGRGWPTPG